jgi:hypothetical protein
MLSSMAALLKIGIKSDKSGFGDPQPSILALLLKMESSRKLNGTEAYTTY